MLACANIFLLVLSCCGLFITVIQISSEKDLALLIRSNSSVLRFVSCVLGYGILAHFI